MKLPKLVEEDCVSWKSFVEFWEKRYHEGKVSDDEYLRALKWKGGNLTKDDIEDLVDWKTDKRRFDWEERLIPHLPTINKNRLTSRSEIWDTARKISKEGPVLQAFICHITSPLEYPIWDINVLRAYLIITDRRKELDNAESLKYECQEYDTYTRFFKSAVMSIEDSEEYPAFRRLDRALFALGTNSDWFGL